MKQPGTETMPILVVDDDSETRKALCDLLRDEGFGATCIENGSLALDHLRKTGVKPGLILLDVDMPEMDGLAFRAAQQGDPALADIPVILMTGGHDVDALRARLGTDVLRKPFSADLLRAALHRRGAGARADAKRRYSAADCLRDRRDELISEWERRARRELPSAQGKGHYVLTDSLPQFLDEMVASLEEDTPKLAAAIDLAEGHAAQRSGIADYDLGQVLTEYQILRRVIFDLLDREVKLSARERDVVLDVLQHGKTAAAKRYSELAVAREVQAASVLRTTEERLILALDAAHMGVWDWDVRSGRLEWSDRLKELWAYGPGEFPGTIEGLLARVHPDDRARVHEALQATLTGRAPYDVTYRVVWPDGSIHAIASQGKASLDPLGAISRVAGFALEITDRLLAEEKLRASEELFRYASRATRDLIWDWDLGSKRLTWTDAICSQLGFAEDVRETDISWWHEHIHPDDRARIVAGVERAMERGQEIWSDEFSFQAADGSYVEVAARGYVVRDDAGEPVRLIGAMQDVTERNRALHALRVSEELFRTLAETMPQMVWTARPDGAVDWCNQGWYDYTRADLSSRWDGPSSPMHPDDAGPAKRRWREALSRGEAYEVEYRFRRASDGQYRWHLGRAVPLKDATGRILKWVGTDTDIHDKKTLLDELKVTEERLALALRASHVGIFECDLITGEVNWTAEEALIFGFAADLRKLTFDEVRERIHPADRELVRSAMDEAATHGHEYRAEFRVCWPDGSTHWLSGMGKVSQEPGTTRLRGVNLDITPRKEQQAALEQALAAVQEALQELQVERALRDRFLSTLTHDLRTPLMTARLSAELAARRADRPDEVVARCAKTVDALRRADKMIQDLLDAHRLRAGLGLSIDVGECDLAGLTRELCDEMATSTNARFELRGPPRLVGFWSGSELRRLLENLLSNAVKYGDTAHPVTVSLQRHDDTVELSVNNRGEPIPADDLPSIFDVFRRARTAEGKPKGWGLGLSLVKGVAEAHGGTVRVDSSAGHGTTFIVELPVDARSASP